MTVSLVLQEHFDRLVAEKKSKDDILRYFIIELNFDPTVASREYSTLAREAGLVPTFKQKSAKINDYLTLWKGNFRNVNDRRLLIDFFATEYDIDEATSSAAIKEFARKQGILLPSIRRNSHEEVVAFVKECLDAGEDSGSIKEKLHEDFGFKRSSAAGAFSKACNELGMSTGRARTDLAAMVAVIRENLSLNRKDLSAKLVEQFGVTASTAQTYLSYIPFAKEFANQAMADSKGA